MRQSSSSSSSAPLHQQLLSGVSNSRSHDYTSPPANQLRAEGGVTDDEAERDVIRQDEGVCVCVCDVVFMVHLPTGGSGGAPLITATNKQQKQLVSAPSGCSPDRTSETFVLSVSPEETSRCYVNVYGGLFRTFHTKLPVSSLVFFSAGRVIVMSINKQMIYTPIRTLMETMSLYVDRSVDVFRQTLQYRDRVCTSVGLARVDLGEVSVLVWRREVVQRMK